MQMSIQNTYIHPILYMRYLISVMKQLYGEICYVF